MLNAIARLPLLLALMPASCYWQVEIVLKRYVVVSRSKSAATTRRQLFIIANVRNDSREIGDRVIDGI